MKHMLRHEPMIAATLTSTPAHPIPMGVLGRIDLHGIWMLMGRLLPSSTASRARIFSCSTCIADAMARVQGTFGSVESLLVPPRDFIDASACMKAGTAYRHMHSLDAQLLVPAKHMQRAMTNKLMQQLHGGDVVRQDVARRAVKFGVVVSNENVQRLFDAIKVCSKKVPSYVLFAVIKGMCNACCIGRRMGQRASCPSCEVEQGSDIQHLVQCPRLVIAIPNMCFRRCSMWPERQTTRDFLGYQQTLAQLVP